MVTEIPVVLNMGFVIEIISHHRISGITVICVVPEQ
jgi:hypothetical protein